LVPKKSADGTPKYRFCTDLRGLNSVTSTPVYPIPVVQSNVSLMAGSKYFMLLDVMYIGTYPSRKKTKIKLVS
jgi:hypothetical protein